MALDPITGVARLLNSGMGIIDQFVEDKDLKAKLAVDAQRMSLEFAGKLVSVQTYRWVDALVKLMYAFSFFTKENWRPVISGFTFLYGLFNPEVLAKLHELGTVGDAGIAAIFSAFPGWMVSRGAEKKRKQEVNKEKNNNFYDDDESEDW